METIAIKSSHLEPLFSLCLSTTAISALIFIREIEEEWGLSVRLAVKRSWYFRRRQVEEGIEKIFKTMEWFGNWPPQKSLFYIRQSGIEAYDLLKEMITSSYLFRMKFAAMSPFRAGKMHQTGWVPLRANLGAMGCQGFLGKINLENV